MIFRASLCATVVTVALGKMAADMNDMADMAWIATSYMLTSTGRVISHSILNSNNSKRNRELFIYNIKKFGNEYFEHLR